MPSGACYTSTLNTFMMIMSCLYTGYRGHFDILPKTSGDDVLALVNCNFSDDALRIRFHRVFKPPGLNLPYGNG